MADVSTYELDQRIGIIERRIETIEQRHLDDLKRNAEREKHKTEVLMRSMTFGLVLIAAVAWTVMITLAVTGN